MQPAVSHWFAAAAAREEAQFRQRWRAMSARLALKLPESFQSYILDGWDARYGIHFDATNGSAVKLANVFARDAVQAFGGARVGSAYDEDRIRDYAENYSRLCALMGSLEQRRAFGLSFGIEPPKGKAITPAGECARWDDQMWWRRQLRKVWTRAAEDAMRAAGIIRKGRSPYASDEAVEHRRRRKFRMQEWIKSRVMVAEQTGETIDLETIQGKSIANPELRNKEFMTRSRGFTEIAVDLGHVGIAATLTCPSHFHAQLSAGGVNPQWEADRAGVREGQQWLCRMWARVRASLKRQGVQVYGFRCAEPHHDATPHWHMMIYTAPEHAQAVRDALRKHWLKEYKDEPGALQYRVKLKDLDPERGGMAAYMAKYFAKNLDTSRMQGQEDFETGTDVADSRERVVAWASAHGIRQFQQVGGPPVGLWRELRRLREPVEAAHAIEATRLRADGGEWRSFIREMGGMERCARRVVSITGKYRRELRRVPRFATGRERIGTKLYGQRKDGKGPLRKGIYRTVYRNARPDEMPAVWLDRSAPLVTDPAGRVVLLSSRYGETPDERVSGVCAYGLMGRYNSANTRKFRWRIEKKCLTSASASISRHSDAGSVSAHIGDMAPAPCTVRKFALHGSTSGFKSAGSDQFLGHDSSPRSGVLSDLGPVAITVRDAAGEAREVDRAALALADEIAGREWREWMHKPSTWKERPPNADQLERIANSAAALSSPASRPGAFHKHIASRRHH
jgi:hypothetical protein